MNHFKVIQSILLLCLIIAAVYTDIKSNKIKNKLVYSMMLMGIVINGMSGQQGIKESFFGILLPGLFLLPLFLLRMLGAGDIKLFSAIGSITGSTFIIKCMLASFLAGGLMALCIMIIKKNMRIRLMNLFQYLKASFLTRSLLPYQDFNRKDNGHFPFAVAIALGTLIVSLQIKI
ncbi:A24 family peptidase [Alkaliphilus crotonatoxidans]